ncbi:hypothetical protein Bca101_064372 [Brassica carinata]
MALSLSSGSSSRTWVYDVFPSFSGEDVRVTFLSHFLKELDRKLIISFKDNEIERSLSLDPELKLAIKESRIAVVIFSEKYASSSWCLNELLEIIKCREECGQMVIPVFYRLDPSHVRKQTGDFGKIFKETCKNKTEQVIIQWSRALTDVANTLGYHSVKWDNEAKLIEEIVSDVSDKLLLTPSKDSEDFVGIEDHIAKLSVLLQLEAEEVRMVGLWGSSGIGKTTIARVLFQRLSRHFQGRIFIDRAFIYKSMEIFNRANPDDYNMKLHLQRNFLSEILGKVDIKINHLSAVEERLKHHKLLIFIDDLDDQVVLDSLVGQTQWFGSGSRIIVVTNDKHFLRGHGIDHVYEVCLPSEDLAVEMLCRYAFRENSPPEGFEELVAEVADHVGRLPLGLSVLGSSLRGRDKEYWVDLLPTLQTGIDGKIERTLKVSYDGLSNKGDKTLFRHIACLFTGEKVTYLKLLLADSGLSINVGMENLADKSLIHVREDHVEMHRLLQEMGRSIVRVEDPENREFLVDSQDICDVLSEGIGTNKVIGITLDIDEIDELHLHENAFRGMRNLRFLKIHSERGLYREVKFHLPENFDYLLRNLKLLRWVGFPLRCLPSNFRPENLVKLEMRFSKLEKLWEGVVALPCLKEMDLSYSHDLIEVPDLSKATNLEELVLRDCYSLMKLPSSIPHPNKLMKLDLTSCRNLETIPIGISLKSLKRLYLDGCSRLRTFPQILTTIETLLLSETTILPPTLLTAIMSPSLKSLYLSDIPNLVELPSSFQNLHQLWELSIKNCVNLETLPTGINLRSLSWLDLSGCSRLKTFPDISTSINIETLNLSETAIEEVPPWIEKFSRLEFLKMDGCINLETLPTGINLPSLDSLHLRGCSRLRTFPDISTSTNIQFLYLSETAIEEVPPWIEKFSSLWKLEMKGCINLETLPTGINLLSLQDLDLSGCSRLRTFPDISTNITTLLLNGTAIEEVPPWIEKFSSLWNLEMKRCINLETLPTGINLLSLSWLDLMGCSRLRTFPDISTNIEYLYLNETAIEEVPQWIEKFSSLEYLEMKRCNKLEYVSLNISKLKLLKRVDLSDCFNLDQEALKTYSDCLLWLSFEEVPSYFTHRTTVTSSSSFSLTAPLLPSYLSQPFLRFTACFLHTWDNMSNIDTMPSLTGRFRNSSDSYEQEQDFRAKWLGSECVADSHMLILDYRTPLSRDSDILSQMNYTHVDLQLDIKNHSPSECKEWGIRLF